MAGILAADSAPVAVAGPMRVPKSPAWLGSGSARRRLNILASMATVVPRICGASNSRVNMFDVQTWLDIQPK
jgi:hypothetical protein